MNRRRRQQSRGTPSGSWMQRSSERKEALFSRVEIFATSPHSGMSQAFTQQVDPNQARQTRRAAGRAESRIRFIRVNVAVGIYAPEPCFVCINSLTVFVPWPWSATVTPACGKPSAATLAHLVPAISTAFPRGRIFDLKGRQSMDEMNSVRETPPVCSSPRCGVAEQTPIAGAWRSPSPSNFKGRFPIQEGRRNPCQPSHLAPKVTLVTCHRFAVPTPWDFICKTWRCQDEFEQGGAVRPGPARQISASSSRSVAHRLWLQQFRCQSCSAAQSRLRLQQFALPTN